MQINSDFTKRALVTPEQYKFVDSLLAGVSRMMLDRVGNEVARASSIVRYAPDSGYTGHTHGDGEEILVLEGVICDEFGQYSQGSWLRNPRYSRHTPFTLEQGAIIYVKTGHIGANLLGDQFITGET